MPAFSTTGPRRTAANPPHVAAGMSPRSMAGPAAGNPGAGGGFMGGSRSTAIPYAGPLMAAGLAAPNPADAAPPPAPAADMAGAMAAVRGVSPPGETPYAAKIKGPLADVSGTNPAIRQRLLDELMAPAGGNDGPDDAAARGGLADMHYDKMVVAAATPAPGRRRGKLETDRLGDPNPRSRKDAPMPTDPAFAPALPASIDPKLVEAAWYNPPQVVGR